MYLEVFYDCLIRQFYDNDFRFQALLTSETNFQFAKAIVLIATVIKTE